MDTSVDSGGMIFWLPESLLCEYGGLLAVILLVLILVLSQYYLTLDGNLSAWCASHYRPIVLK